MLQTELRIRAACAAALLTLAACGGGGGGGGGSTPPPPPPSGNFTDPVIYSSAPSASLQTAAEIVATTQHQITLNGASLSYTATAGHMTARHITTAAPQASFFYVAYTQNNANAATRPVTFFYNGGPGSASVWLHIGSFGPKRLQAGFPSTTGTVPFPMVDNAESMLDISDLVFVDAVGSGYSQAIAPNTNQSFWGVDVDAAVFRDFVMRYLTVNNRNASPKFLFGESYGGPRSGVLALLLEQAGVRLSGVVLQSPAMNYNSTCGLGSPAPCTGFIPSYGATGAWYNLTTPAQAPAAIPAYMQTLRTFSTTQYDPAVRALIANGTTPAPTLITQLNASTGLPVVQWQANLNITPTAYRANIMPGTTIGRYDSRLSAQNGTFLASQGDPSSTYINASFAQGIINHLTTNLNYTTPSNYTVLSNAIQSWNFSHDGLQVPDTIPDLAAAIAINPNLKIMAQNGYHDLATPFYQTELDLARLGNNPNIRVRNYMGGHMTYLEDASRIAQKADLVQFYQNALQAQ
jgi:carboxypeptidase C (cathepsin A)